MENARDFSAAEELSGAGAPASRQALDDLFSYAYEELRRLAAAARSDDAEFTRSTTAMVDAAWRKFAGTSPRAPASRLHFKRIAARAMRQVMIEAARRRSGRKRGNHAVAITFDEELETGASSAEELLALDAALDDLARLHPRQAMMLESRFFGGLDMTEIAAMLDVSEATVVRDWRAARAWLATELRAD